MSPQNFQQRNEDIRSRFQARPDASAEPRRLNLSWSNWGFGMEPLEVSVRRLANNGIQYIELHGNHYGPDLGYRAPKTRKILADHGVKAAGVCGMFSRECDLSSPSGVVRQEALDYLRRELDFAEEMGAGYLLVCPAAVGRATPYDDCEFERSVETLRLVGDLFVQHRVKAAIEPIRSAETSIVHSFADAKRYIQAINHPGVRHINGDVYHMQVEESHIAMSLVDAGEQLVNLHMADSNRCALGAGSLDLDCIIMALHLIGYNRDGCFVTPEPLGPGGDPYPAMYGKPDPAVLDELVRRTALYFREREQAVLSGN